jgi:arsenate reductase (thioredoxin)
MSDFAYNVLFLCTGNSARSILAEAILNKKGQGRFRAFSAGSQAKGEVNPYALALLRNEGYDVSSLRSKSWAEFAQAGAPKLDFIFTVCDSAAGESCPLWRGKPVTAHWGISDPAAVKSSEVEIAFAFKEAYRKLKLRIDLFMALSLSTLDSFSLTARLKEIGRAEGATLLAKPE